MNSKMTNSQLLTTEPKKQKQKLSKQLEQEQNHRNGDHKEGYQQGGEEGRMEGKGTGNKKHNWQAQNRQVKVNSIGNGEAKEFICMTHGDELKVGEGMQVGEGCRAKGKNGTTVIA